MLDDIAIGDYIKFTTIADELISVVEDLAYDREGNLINIRLNSPLRPSKGQTLFLDPKYLLPERGWSMMTAEEAAMWTLEQI